MSDEEKRLRALLDLVILDSAPEPFFDALAQLASEVCHTPIAIMSLIDKERQWHKASVGLSGLHQVPRDLSFCAHTIEHPGIFEVPDAKLDARFAHNPFVTGSPDIRFYAGAPLTAPDGERVGTLCVIDSKPRQLEVPQAQMLTALSQLASLALAMRHDLIARALSARSLNDRDLAKSDSVHRTLLDAQAEMISLAQADGTLIYVNPACASHYGISVEQMLGSNLFSYSAPADREQLRALIAKVLATDEVILSENRLLSPGVPDRWVSWTNRSYIDFSGARLIHSVGRDVSERRLIQRDLLASQQMMARAGHLARVGGWEFDITSGIGSWSEMTREIFELSAEADPTFDVALKLFDEPGRTTLTEAIEVALSEGTPWDLELPMSTTDGRSLWIRSIGEVELGADAKPAKLVGAIVDITPSKSLALRLDHSERFTRQVIDNLPIGVVYVDKNLRYQFVNAEHARRFGLPRDQMIGRSREDITGAPLSAQAQGIVERALTGSPECFEAIEISNGKSRLIENRVIPALDAQGHVVGLYGVSIDLTERSANDQRLHELTTILETSTDFIVQASSRGEISYMNPAARVYCGLAPAESTAGRYVSEFNTPETNELFARVIIPQVALLGSWTGEVTVCSPSGAIIPVSHLVIGHQDAQGRVERYSAVMRDISSTVASRAALEDQSDVLHAVLEAIPASIAVVGADGCVSLVNRAYEHWTGVGRDLAVGAPLAAHFSPQGSDGERRVRQALAGETASYQMAVHTPFGDRHIAGSYLPLKTHSGAFEGFIAVAQDITESKREEVRLLQLAQRDPLTGLLNRSGLDQEARRMFTAGEGDRLALLCIDLDYFKPINDTHGHPVGDALLRTFAHRMERLVRPTDSVARIGGDEFAILLVGVDAASGADTVADKVVAAAAEIFEVGSLRLHVSASVGIAYKSNPAGGWAELMERADVKLYEAKGAGRGCRA